MALAPNGPYGHLNGRLGNIIHYMLKGQPVCRMIGINTKPATLKQKANRRAMAVVTNLLAPALRMVNAGFDLEAAGTTRNAHNLAVSYNRQHALTGDYPDIRVDYSKALFSKGSLGLAKDLKMEFQNGQVHISWDTIAPCGKRRMDDMVMVLILYPGEGGATCTLNAGPRHAGRCTLPFEGKAGSQAEVYVAFRAADGTAVSDSHYLGNLNGVPETAETKLKREKYERIKTRYVYVSAAYAAALPLNTGPGKQSKVFRNLETEYLALKRKLEELPGNPV